MSNVPEAGGGRDLQDSPPVPRSNLTCIHFFEHILSFPQLLQDQQQSVHAASGISQRSEAVAKGENRGNLRLAETIPTLMQVETPACRNNKSSVETKSPTKQLINRFNTTQGGNQTGSQVKAADEDFHAAAFKHLQNNARSPTKALISKWNKPEELFWAGQRERVPPPVTFIVFIIFTIFIPL